MKMLVSYTLALIMVMSVCGIAGAEEFSYPMDGQTVTFSAGDPGTNNAEWLDEQYGWWNQMEQRTGITIVCTGGKFSNLNTEEFLLLLADDDLPDIIWGPDLFKSFVTNPAMLIEDGYILRLNDYADSLPNYMGYLDKHPELAASITLEDGTLFCFPRYDEEPPVGQGLMIRGDWLQELNLEVPNTPEAMKEVLKAFRDNKGATTPISFQPNYLWEGSLSAGWDNFGMRFYQEDGVVKFGVLEKGFREFVTEMGEWYAEGLIDPDMPSASKQSVEAAMSNGSAGIVGNQISKIENMYNYNADNPTYSVVGFTISAEGDEIPSTGVCDQRVDLSVSFLISADCENLEAALRWCDYQYSEDGILLNSFGTQGYSWDYDEQGNVVAAGILLDDTIPEVNTNKVNAVSKGTNWGGVLKSHFFGLMEPALNASKAWSATTAMDHMLPYLTYTVEESETYSQAYADCTTLIKESVINFIMGVKPLEEYDAFIEQLHAFGIDACIEVQQAAYDRYLANYAKLTAVQ